jgi:hypothetical protein
VVAVLALLVAAGAVAGFVYDGRDGPAPANARAAPAPPDPFLYIATGNLLHLSREQTCDGLFGLCLGQPVDFALSALGNAEADGFPLANGQIGGQTSTCHGWKPKQLDQVTVCDLNKTISSIRVDSYSTSPIAVAAPHGNVVTLGGLSSEEAAKVTGKLARKPFRSEYVPSEGESIWSFEWYLDQPPDGDPDTEMWVIGRVPKMLGSPPDPCPGAEDNYAYNKLQPLSDQAPVTSVTVATIESDSGQSAEPSC